MGYTRHLTPGEIVAQAVHVARALRETVPAKRHLISDIAPERLRNVVLMGMGEPLHNYDAVMHAIDILRDGRRRARESATRTRKTRAASRGVAACRDASGARRARPGRQKMAAR